MRDLLYFEPIVDGHASDWAHLILRAAQADPRCGRIVALVHPDLAIRLSGLRAPDLDIVSMPTVLLNACTQGGPIRQGLAQWSAIRTALRDHGLNAALLPFLDHALVGAVLDRRPLPGPVSGLVFRPTSAEASALRRFRMRNLYLFSARPALKHLFCLDPVFVAAQRGALARRLRALPDPVLHGDLLRAVPSAPAGPGADRRSLLILGALGARKGLYEVCAALQTLSVQAQAGITLHLAGRILAAERLSVLAALEALRQAAPALSIVCTDRFLEPEELATAIKRADAVLLAYRDHVGSSGVLGLAAAAGRPVIAQRAGLLGDLVEQHGLGVTLDPTDSAALAAAMITSVPHDAVAMEAFAQARAPHHFTAPLLDTVLGPSR